MLGSEEQPKDVLEYLVIERHLVNAYGRWRLHGKIVPSWAPAKDPIIKVTLRYSYLLVEEEEAPVKEVISINFINWRRCSDHMNEAFQAFQFNFLMFSVNYFPLFILLLPLK